MSHFLEANPNVDCFSGHDVKCGQLGLRCGYHDVLNDVGYIKDCAVVR